jgi:hypothetical protein
MVRHTTVTLVEVGRVFRIDDIYSNASTISKFDFNTCGEGAYVTSVLVVIANTTLPSQP